MEKCQKTKLAPHLTYYQIQVIKGLIDEEVGGVAKMALLPYLIFDRCLGFIGT